VLVPNF